MKNTCNAPLGVVIPAYGHPGFLSEAIVSACEQECSRPVKVVVVDDGCRFPETGEVTASLQACYPERLFYFRQKNTRLPGARNAGIRFLLELEPHLDAIFFLDADNRLEPYSLEHYRIALGDDPTVGWAYPDITFFGLSWGEEGFETRETSTNYSQLRHLAGNISEAGSLVRASVFRNGVFFDETMKSGLEDWDFWLSALSAGFQGIRAKHSGFIYRRRPESMLASSQRESRALLLRLRKKHADLFSPEHILRLEHSEDPIFAIHIAGEETVRLTSDPLLEGKVCSLESFKAQIQARLRDELEHFFPDYFLLLSPEEAQRWQGLDKHLRWCFWMMKEVSPEICQVDLNVGTSSSYTYTMCADVSHAKALLISQRELKAFVRQLTTFNEFSCKPQGILSLHLPNKVCRQEEYGCLEPSQSKISLPDTLFKLVDFFRGSNEWSRHQNRQYSGPAAVIIRKNLVDDICGAEAHRPYPSCSEMPRGMFVFSGNKLGGTQLYNVTELMKKHKAQERDIGCIIECGFSGVDLQRLPSEWEDLVSDIVYYPLSQGVNESRTYLGYRISCKMIPPQIEEVSVLSRTVDQLFLVGDVACIEAAGEIRQHGTGVTLISLETDTFVNEKMAKYLAYEHVIDRLVVHNIDMKDLLSSSGFPSRKIITWNMI